MTTKITIDSREDWLNAAIVALRPLAKARGFTIPEKLRASCGFPKGRSKAIGQCWSSLSSKDSTFETFISPALDESTRVLDILVHEIGHAAVGLEAKHGPKFAKFCKAFHLNGPWKSTTAAPEFNDAIFAPVMTALGGVKYPHAAMTTMTNGQKKQSTRMLKCICGECGYTARTSARWLDTLGAPICPCNDTPMEVA